MEESFPTVFSTRLDKEKLFVTSNFSFSHSVFKRLVSQGRQKVSLCGNGLNLDNSNILSFGKVLIEEKTWLEKVESLVKMYRLFWSWAFQTNFSEGKICHFRPFPNKSVLAVGVFWKYCGKNRNYLYWVSPFSTVFYTLLKNCPPFPSNLKLSSFSLD